MTFVSGGTDAAGLAVPRELMNWGGMELMEAAACSVLMVTGNEACLEVASVITTSSGVVLPGVEAGNAGFH